LRIIAGEFRGRTLEGPRAAGVRPTSDRLRETLFNLVDVETPGCAVLDGFAGTGAVGLEAISRGAAHVTFVERDAKAVAVIRRNVAACGAGDRCVIIPLDFIRFSRQFGSQPPFHLVLLDPPYDYLDMDAVLTGAAAMLRPGGLVVLEHARRRAVPEIVSGLALRRQVHAGDSELSFYALAAAGSSSADAG
jgi:16S rRNA (guanine(966)-N(2))-methyltransferase RsmD